MFIQVKNASKSYGEKENSVKVLNSVNVGIKKGEICLVLGPSGSGKSTFLNVIGGLDTIDSGEIIVNGVTIANLKVGELLKYRRDYLGFIFQFYNLVPNLTVRENIELCKYISDNPLDIDEVLGDLGMKEHQHKFPAQLSGGQQQRCAIGRAFVKNPALMLCDEPTGALDSKSSKDILILLEKINKKYGTTMIIVTHNTAIKEMADHVIHIKDGQVSSDTLNNNKKAASEVNWE
ncbi:putative ABC transport system ATP-binding protein [Ruminiclostridium sufflavum DSM 19573]|uniref:Putative ABC transport system ATP-binding protein n=1 Tax=Ruminiclostridium sufflavum DSM 19573 TaxID=1121337 RepID=A0A318XSE8_9FIRM|nr:ABC transporter ATP-binding protein [Ruminiclostridium sufflavum]PYG89171.1 putative ABC transport system ATP-binding protein [Ruminiclostridium sufflavum DSM 19573]